MSRRTKPVLQIPKGPIAIGRVDGDWLAMDAAGKIAVFAGGDAGIIPTQADPAMTVVAFAAIDASTEARRTGRHEEGTYRGAAMRDSQPVFDPPTGAHGRPTHETPCTGYPHLVFAADAQALRDAIGDVVTRDAAVREGLAIVIPDLGFVLHEALHETGLCAACRVLDAPGDARLRSPESITGNGIYLFAHSGSADDATYYRVASPEVASDEHALDMLIVHVARLVRLPLLFDETEAIGPEVL